MKTNPLEEQHVPAAERVILKAKFIAKKSMLA